MWEAAVEQMDQQAVARSPHTDSLVTGALVLATATARLRPSAQSLLHFNATRLIGLTVTPTSLLMPTKSVTAVIGLFDGEVHDAQSRPTCNMPHARALPLPAPHHLLFQPLGALDVYSAYHP